MILAIISFAIEIVFLVVTNALSRTDSLTKEFAIFVIVVFVLCTLISIGCIVYNSIRMKNRNVSKGVSVPGFVFSIVGAALGSIFCITCFATMLAHL